MNKKATVYTERKFTFSLWDVCYLPRRLVSDNSFVYKLYTRLFCGEYTEIFKSYFNSNINAYYDGYERSGNTFLAHLVNDVFPELRDDHHHHKIAPLKNILRKEVPVFVIFRDPDDCIPSKYLAHYIWNEKEIPLEEVNLYQLRKYSYDYYYYYKFVEK